ncbi:MAG: hypothetical protein BGO98_02965 [Myxococcales bacterium 68-20]|nr:MAG: hypothetical protein BGO98_02965 [Myxococcales bacterium 68-20]
MRSIAKLPVLLLAVTLAAVGCAVTFGPGDYTGEPVDAAVPDAASQPDVTSDAPIDVPDGALPVAGRRLLLIAGEKDGSDIAANDVWTAPIDEKGDVGAFEYLQPAPFRGAAVTANVASGRLFVASRALGRSVEHVAIDGGVLTSGWTGQAVGAPMFAGYSQIFAGSSLLALGGAGDVDDGLGGTILVWDDTIHITPFDGTSFDGLNASSTRLPVGIRDAAVIAYKEFVYVIGGTGAASDQRSKVYVARIDPTAGVGAFVETTRVVNPTTNQPHTPFVPMICAGEGRLFIAGGSGSDIVLSSTIDETSGALGPWKAATKLPGALRGAGCAIWDATIHLIGGIGATSRTDRIIRARFEKDGTLGEWELTSGEKLPAPRSSIIAVTF